MQVSSVCAVIVAYNSDINKLRLILSALLPAPHYIIVDNSTDLDKKNAIESICQEFHAKYLDMNGNVGIATAQNEGINTALENGFSDFLLLDDDSVANPNMLNVLLSSREKICKITDILPVVCASPYSAEKLELANYGRQAFDGIHVYRDIISSGSLVNKQHYEDVGLHEERLFIDCVDFEWGWRARSKQIPIYIILEAKLQHQLGDGELKIIPARYGSPIRHYYQYRNVLYMICRHYVPSEWKVSQSIKLLIKPFLIVFFFDRKIQRLKYLLKGIYDFSKGKDGSI